MLSIIRYGLGGTIQRMEQRPPLHLGVIAIENEAFGSLSTTITNITDITNLFF